MVIGEILDMKDFLEIYTSTGIISNPTIAIYAMLNPIPASLKFLEYAATTVVIPIIGIEVNIINIRTKTGLNIWNPANKSIITHMTTCKDIVMATAILFPIIIWAWEIGIAISISPVFLSFSPTILSIIMFPNNKRGKNSRITSITFFII